MLRVEFRARNAAGYLAFPFKLCGAIAGIGSCMHVIRLVRYFPQVQRAGDRRAIWRVMGKLGAFTMSKTGRGRGRGRASAKAAPKTLIVPKAGSLQPKAAPSGASEPRDAPVQLAVIQWTRVAHKAIESFGDDPLWQIQLKHDGKPTVSMQLIRHFGNYLTVLRETDDSIPESIQALKERAGIALQLAGGTVQWRAAWYVEGPPEALQNALRLILGFVHHRWNSTAPGERGFPGDLRIELDVDPSIVCKNELAEMPVAPMLVRNLDLSPFSPAPPAGAQILTFQIEFNETNGLTGVLAGATWAFRKELEANGIYGARVEADDSYVRVLPCVDVSTKNGRDWILQKLFREILCDTVLHLVVATPPLPETAGAEFLQILGAQPHVYTEK